MKKVALVAATSIIGLTLSATTATAQPTPGAMRMSTENSA